MLSLASTLASFIILLFFFHLISHWGKFYFLVPDREELQSRFINIDQAVRSMRRSLQEHVVVNLRSPHELLNQSSRNGTNRVTRENEASIISDQVLVWDQRLEVWMKKEAPWSHHLDQYLGNWTELLDSWGVSPENSTQCPRLPSPGKREDNCGHSHAKG